jgi:hypothetical protein
MYIKLQVITATTTSHWNLNLHNKQQSRKLEDTIKRRTDNAVAKGRRTDNAMAKGTNSDLLNTTQQIKD